MLLRLIAVSGRDISREKYRTLNGMACRIVADMLNANRPFDEVTLQGEIAVALESNIIFKHTPQYTVIMNSAKETLHSYVSRLWHTVQSLQTPEKIKSMAREVINNNRKVFDVDFEKDINTVLEKHVNGIYFLAQKSPYFEAVILQMKTEILRQTHPVHIIYPQETIRKEVSELLGKINEYQGLNKLSAGMTTAAAAVSIWQIPGFIRTIAAIRDWDSLKLFIRQDTLGAAAIVAIMLYISTRLITFVRTMASILGTGDDLIRLYQHPRNYENFLQAVNKQTGSTRAVFKQFVRYRLSQDLDQLNRLTTLLIDTKNAFAELDDTGESQTRALQAMKKFQSQIKFFRSRIPNDSALYKALYYKMNAFNKISQFQEYQETFESLLSEEYEQVQARDTVFKETLEYPEDASLKLQHGILSMIVACLEFIIKSKPKTK